MDDFPKRPVAPWPDAPRWRPALPLPHAPYIPGGPIARPPESLQAAPAAWRPEDWRDLDAWLYGVDCYHAGFPWEAHEAWEALWQTAPAGSPQNHLLQGLILLAAAEVKVAQGRPRGVALQSRKSRERLAEAAGAALPATRVMGADPGALSAAVEARYSATWRDPASGLAAPPPRLELA